MPPIVTEQVQLYGRRVVVFVDTLRVEGGAASNLRVQFKITKTIKHEPNAGDIKITNLSKDSRAGMKKKWVPVVLLAGYAEKISQVFSGQARSLDHVREKADWETRIMCGDGGQAYQYGLVNQSFGPGTQLKQVVQTIAASMGLDATQAISRISSGSLKAGFGGFPGGYAMTGSAQRNLTQALAAAGLSWSIQDGKIQVLQEDESLKTNAIYLTPETGLIGSPEHAAPQCTGRPAVLNVKSLLQPQAKAGSRVVLNSEFIKGGVYRAEKVEHTGDTEGGDWYTSFELKPVAGSTPA